MTTGPGSAPSPRQRVLKELAAELTPAKSLARLDAATARVVSTVSVVATLLTGLGLVAAGLPDTAGVPRALAVASVGLAFLAVLCALAAQILTVTRGLNTNNLKQVERWYGRRFGFRAPLTSAASVLLVLAAGCAGAVAVLTLVGDHADPPTLAVTRTTELPAPGATSPATASKLTVEVTFRGLDPGQVATTTVTADGVQLAQAAFTPGPDGTAARTLTVEHVTAGMVRVEAKAGTTACTGRLTPGTAAEVTCR